MQLTPVGLEMLKMFEDVRLTAYKDSVGVWTIGYGHTAGVKEGQTCTMQEAEDFLKNDLYLVEFGINGALSQRDVPIAAWQYDALVSFAFNLGFGALKSSTLFNLVLSVQFEREAAQEFARWIYAGGKPLVGLKRRRFAEAVRYLGGDFPMVSMAYHGVS